MEGKQIQCSMMELGEEKMICRVLVVVEGVVVVVGFEPTVFCGRYVQKTEKGFMNMSTF